MSRRHRSAGAAPCTMSGTYLRMLTSIAKQVIGDNHPGIFLIVSPAIGYLLREAVYSFVSRMIGYLLREASPQVQLLVHGPRAEEEGVGVGSDAAIHPPRRVQRSAKSLSLPGSLHAHLISRAGIAPPSRAEPGHLVAASAAGGTRSRPAPASTVVVSAELEFRYARTLNSRSYW
eukprot:4702963-Pyramimonas_sp.AAC.2